MDYSDASILIHLIKNIDSSNNDDSIRIRKNLTCRNYDVTYSDTNDNLTANPIVHKLTNMNRDEVLDYLYTVFKNQSLDDEGYKHIQITLPALPRIIVKGEKLKDLYYREHFVELFESSLDMLEKITVVSSTNKKTIDTFSTPYYQTPQHMKFNY
jgi:hypothetical protein